MEDISPENLKAMYEMMVMIRLAEEKIVDLYPEQEIKCPVHLYIGQEAVAAGVCAILEEHDYVFSNHRGHGHYIAKGGDLNALMAELYGKASGCSGGKGGSMHLADPEKGIMGTSAIVGGCLPLAVGAALSSAIQKNNRISTVFFGDGAVDEGVFHESLNFASLKKLPVVFVCENNFYATNSPQLARHPADNIAKRAEGYRMPGVSVDGNDVVAVCWAAREAARRARSGEGPTLIECRTYRWKAHVGPACDVESGCRSKRELDKWMEKCPIKSFAKFLLGQRIISREQVVWIEEIANEKIEKAVAFGKAGRFPEKDDVMEDVY